MSKAVSASSLRSGPSIGIGLRALALSTLVGGGALAALGCEENESSLFIVGVLAIERSDCILTPEGTSILRTDGVLDLALRSSYTAGLLVGSQLTQRGSRDQLRTETARLSLRGAEVRLASSSGGVIAEYTTIGTGLVHPAGGAEPGYGVMSVDLIPAGAPIGPGLLVANIRVFGDTLGGDEIESNEFSFPIYVCNGCLVSYPAEAADMTQGPGVYLCAVRGEDTPVNEDQICNLGQDVGVPCSECAAHSAVCLDPCQNCSARSTGLDCSGSPVPTCP
jgi:hypothetical protein